jgi:Flp pilus assembly protein TadD
MRLNPNLADAHFALGKALVGKADLDGAIAELKVAVRMKPDSARPHHTLGAVLEKKGDLKSALEEYRRASQLEPSNGDIRRAYENLSLN